MRYLFELDSLNSYNYCFFMHLCLVGLVAETGAGGVVKCGFLPMHNPTQTVGSICQRQSSISPTYKSHNYVMKLHVGKGTFHVESRSVTLRRGCFQSRAWFRLMLSTDVWQDTCTHCCMYEDVTYKL